MVAKRRLSSDASIALRNAGFPTSHIDFHGGKAQTLAVQVEKGDIRKLAIEAGTVDNEEVVAILGLRK